MKNFRQIVEEARDYIPNGKKIIKIEVNKEGELLLTQYFRETSFYSNNNPLFSGFVKMFGHPIELNILLDIPIRIIYDTNNCDLMDCAHCEHKDICGNYCIKFNYKEGSHDTTRKD